MEIQTHNFSSTLRVKKECHPNHGRNLSILDQFAIFFTLWRALNFPYQFTYHILTMLMYNLGKLKNRNCVLFVHVFLCDFLSLVQQNWTDICRMSWKCVQRQTLCKIGPINILLFKCVDDKTAQGRSMRHWTDDIIHSTKILLRKEYRWNKTGVWRKPQTYTYII